MRIKYQLIKNNEGGLEDDDDDEDNDERSVVELTEESDND